MPCLKRGFTSKSAARQAHRGAHWRIRAYECGHCGAWHVANAEKNTGGGPADYASFGEDPGLAPTMTLQQLKAEAERRRKLS